MFLSLTTLSQHFNTFSDEISRELICSFNAFEEISITICHLLITDLTEYEIFFILHFIALETPIFITSITCTNKIRYRYALSISRKMSFDTEKFNLKFESRFGIYFARIRQIEDI